MKKYAKILCAILVVAALCSSLIFTAGADEGEAFEPSYTVSDFAGNTITSGTDYKSDVAGNRINGVSTMNEKNSPFLSIAKGESENSYIVAYANKSYSDTPKTDNNLGINASTSNSEPFTVVGDDAQGYYVIDFDVATHGNILPGFDVSVVMRRASDKAGYPFSDEIFVGNYVTELNEWSHVTIIGDIKNNVIKVYINGQYVGDSGQAVRNAVGDANKLGNDTQVVAQGYRIELTRNNQPVSVSAGDQVSFDNFAHRLYINNGDDLAAALTDGDITDWAGYTAGRGKEPLPVVATVDGVEYRNFSKLSNAFATNDTVNIEFLAMPISPMPICVNANINTNGMDHTKLFTVHSGCDITSVDGNMVYTSAPFVSNASEEYIVTADAYSVLKYAHPDNILSRFQASNHGVVNGRAMYKVMDKYTGVTYVNERVYRGTVTNASDTYNGWLPGNKITYVTGDDQHIVIDFDVAMHSEHDYILKVVTRTASGGSAWGSNDINLSTIYAGNELDTFVHVTLVLSTDTKDGTVFVNGKYFTTANDIITDTSDHYFENLRTGGNSSANVSFANLCMREVRDGDLTSAISSNNISSWSGNLYNEGYSLPTPPTIVAVDGVGYYNEATLEAALYGNKKTPAVVKVLHAFDNVITVNCDAVIYTYGQDVNFVDVNGKKLTPAKNGVIYIDIAYMPVRLEQSVDVTGGSASLDIYNAINFNIANNLFSSVVPSVGNWNQSGYRSSSLVTNIETGDVVYRSSAKLGSDGELSADSAEYTDMKFKAATLSYAEDKNSYVVVDFDFATDRAISDDVSVVLIPSAGATASANAVLLKDLGVLDGDSAHVTVVYDFTNNSAYVFVNGLFACSVEDAVVADNTDYLAGTAVTVDTFRLSTEGKTSSVCLDNVAIRSFSYAVEDDTLIDTVDSGDITNWDGSIFNSKYTISKIPTVAVVDGRDYGSVDTVNKLLAIATTYAKRVEIKYSPATPVLIRTEASVETNGLNVALDWNTGLYEFDPGVERYRGTRTGLAYASTKFIYTTVGTTYTFEVINAENCWSNASVAAWAYKVTRSGRPIVLEDYDVVFYPHGEKMEPIVDGKYVSGGALVSVAWFEMKITSETTYERLSVSEYPIASASESLKIYVAQSNQTNVSYAATDMLYSANISTGIEFIFYVNKQQTVTDTGNVVTINGKEYVAFVYNLAPHEIDKVITVSFDVKNVTDVYTQTQDICFVDYVRGLLEDGSVDKSLIVSLLNYANESHALLFGGEKMPEVTELVNTYAEYLPNEALTEKLDTAELRSVVRSASIRMNSTPEFVFKIARGFRGTITISYNTLGTPVEYSVYVNTLACEENVTLKGLNVYDVAGDITITITPYGSDTSIVGQYNLATYAQGLEDNGFAVALYNYAKTALKYHNANVEKYLPV